MTYNVTALVLRRGNFRENDLRVVFFSREQGKIEAVAVGAKKIKSKLAGHLEPLRLVKVMLAKGKNFDKIGQVTVRRNFGFPRMREAETLFSAQKMAASVEKWTAERSPEKHVFDFLIKFLELLSADNQPSDLTAAFLFRLLNLSGFAPELYHCLACRRSLEPSENYFDFSNGGLICPLCFSRQEKGQGRFISGNALKILRYWQKQPAEKIFALRLAPSLREETERLVEDFSFCRH